MSVPLRPCGRRFALEASALHLRGLLGGSEPAPASKLFLYFLPTRPPALHCESSLHKAGLSPSPNLAVLATFS